MSSWSEQHRVFADKVISLRGNVRWPARSPDLSPCDYFLWGYIKAEVFKLRPKTIIELKEAIVKSIAEVPKHMIDNVMDNFRQRLQHCVEVGGGHLKNVIFKK